MLSAFTGSANGRPDWVAQIEKGDDAGFFGVGSAAWAVHGGMPTLVAGIRALLMQTLHPGAMAGVHDWSRYREDPLGRLSGTIQWLIGVTFSDTAMAVRESTRVGRFHDRVTGTYLDAQGVERSYSAGDPELLSWVHVVFTDAFLGSHMIWGGRIPGGADQYVREWTKAGELIGVVDPPASEAELRSQLDAFRTAGILKSDERVAEAVRFIRSPGLTRGMMPAYRILFAGAVASIPADYRRLLGLRRPWWPAITATRAVLALAGKILGTSSTSEVAARRRLARLGLLPMVGEDVRSLG
ncbi:oxygenase MpaB family protein [Glaciihabitans sp. UYNi722]|uniref:oxygenase MpaB family protein n=1 Tax=Glaciihabitans sp. UYNi722 TaxID=3156344 RepID=UPI003393BD52